MNGTARALHCGMSTPRKTRRTVDYRSVSKPSTLEKHNTILYWLANAGDGFTVTELARACGMSRQLALYHVKKLAAMGELVMQLEPCVGNGGLQFRLWDERQLAARYIETYSTFRRAA